jgi:hypothetical protein
MLSWAGEIRLEDVLAAAGRQLRQRAGYDLPAAGPFDLEPPLTELLVTEPPPTEPTPSAAHPVLRVGDLAGQAQLGPGPALAGWLSCASAGELDDAGLVNSVAGWRKVTSWAHAQELAGVAELARRRGISSGAGPYRTLDKQDQPTLRRMSWHWR